jgi:hypothetical protein
MKLQPCGCDPQHYARVQRRGWMRIFDARRLYVCRQCHTLAFLRRNVVDKMLIEAAADRMSQLQRSAGAQQ